MADKQQTKLVMGREIIGVMDIDYETGEFTGSFVNPELAKLMDDFFEDGLLEVMFYGNPGANPKMDIREKIDEITAPNKKESSR